MSTVTEIKSAIEQLPSTQLSELSRWFDDSREKTWDAQMEADAKAGKFSYFKEEVARAKAANELIDFP